MMLRIGVIGAALVLALTATGLAAAGGDGEGATDRPAEVSTQQGSFVGLDLEEATVLAESQGRPWRIRREDTNEFVTTDDLVAGRVTFEVDDGIVTSSLIEPPNPGPPPESITEDPARAELVASGLLRLVTTDNSFGGGDAFDEIVVATTVGSEGATLLPLDLELIASTLSEFGLVRFVEDADAEINAHFDSPPVGVAVVAVERIELLDDRAELELRLWCGSLCGVFLTYAADSVDGGWEITGTTGPIAVS